MTKALTLQNNTVSNLLLVFATLFALFLLARPVSAQDRDGDHGLKAELISFNQVPSVLATSHRRFEAKINDDNTISFKLSYADMSSPVLQAHIHFGASRTNGGIMVFLCGVLKPACPASGEITGTITAADVSVLPATNGDSVIPQGVPPGDFVGLVKAIHSGNTYINVHTANFPSGEIRGQVHFDRPDNE